MGMSLGSGVLGDTLAARGGGLRDICGVVGGLGDVPGIRGSLRDVPKVGGRGGDIPGVPKARGVSGLFPEHRKI